VVTKLSRGYFPCDRVIHSKSLQAAEQKAKHRAGRRRPPYQYAPDAR